MSSSLAATPLRWAGLSQSTSFRWMFCALGIRGQPYIHFSTVVCVLFKAELQTPPNCSQTLFAHDVMSFTFSLCSSIGNPCAVQRSKFDHIE